MVSTNSKIQAAISSLIGLIVINFVMLGALFSQVPPNPPGRFGPYIGTTVALAAVSLLLICWKNKIGYISSIIVGIMCMVSLGPQKLFTEYHASQVAPIIISGSIFAIVLIISSFMAFRGTNDMNFDTDNDRNAAQKS
jgi:hypothetical protein